MRWLCLRQRKVARCGDKGALGTACTFQWIIFDMEDGCVGVRIGRVLGVLCCIGILLYIAAYRLGDNRTIDYGQYLRKTWVVDAWHGGEDRYHACFSFVIMDIKDGFVEGLYDATGYIGLNHMRRKFQGKMKGQAVECSLYGASGIIGMMELTFLEENQIEGVIIIDEGAHRSLKFTFRPYSLYDVKDLYINPSGNFTRKSAEIDTWGEVNLVAGIIDGYKSYPAVFMTDASDNILFRFESGYQTASEIYDVSVDDYDGDGLDDVRIVNYFPYEEDSIYIDRTFYQTEEGLFEEKR